ncbi:MAG: hypothetical protein KKF20_08080 [Bacteroidetes bacterium]|nr:hypothetical protein [Bacteroidota bacterium]MBU1422614.1 hypothetical protein [Bacteroidota bacterium]MBU2472347.1 hypothetical protein [Bacteroidota bacterium]
MNPSVDPDKIGVDGVRSLFVLRLVVVFGYPYFFPFNNCYEMYGLRPHHCVENSWQLIFINKELVES